ncbi:hypothetical protein [Parvularcula sp. IMCC14364]|uniref:hypothetical protein n=1 Tax=Parvularcula sp. IMCC14364 TaxID=3067902 RepID=UPI00274284FC|nr:hypothetical protein [Parvularcula sp. IMCC14364]
MEVEPEANATFAESRRLEVNGPNYFLPTVGGSETGPSSMPVARTVTFASYPPPASARQWFGPIAVREDEATVWLRPTFDDYDADRSEEDARLIQLINQGRTPYVPIAHEIGLFLGDAPSVLGTLSLPRQGGRVRATFSRDGDAVFGNFDGGVCWRWNLTRTEFETLTCSTDLALASVACATCAVEGWQIVQIRDARNDLRVIKEVNSQSGAQRARLWSRTRNETLAKLTIASKARPAGIDFDTDVEISDDGEWLAVVANNGEVFVFQIRDLISS